MEETENLQMSEKDEPGYDTSELNEVLGKPPLLNGEDRDKSKKLRIIVREALRPKDVFDELNVREIASAIWEADRFKKMRQAFLESKYPAAYRNLMERELPNEHKGLTQEEIFKKVDLERLQA